MVEPFIQPPMWRFPVAKGGFAIAEGASIKSLNKKIGGISKPAPAAAAADSEVTVRKQFPESWLWSDITNSE